MRFGMREDESDKVFCTERQETLEGDHDQLTGERQEKAHGRRGKVEPAGEGRAWCRKSCTLASRMRSAGPNLRAKLSRRKPSNTREGEAYRGSRLDLEVRSAFLADYQQRLPPLASVPHIQSVTTGFAPSTNVREPTRRRYSQPHRKLERSD